MPTATETAVGRPSSLTHAHEGGLVVFHIGMTLRRPHRVDLWLPVARAMTRMIAELHANREAAARGEQDDLGFLGAELLVGARGPMGVQYWRSASQLYGYASRADRLHVPAWRAFTRAAREHPEAVGIWHETYEVGEDGISTLYRNGALAGLGAATGTRPLPARRRPAPDRP